MTEAEAIRITRNWTTSLDTWQRDTRWGSENEESWVYPPPGEFIPKPEGYKWRALPEPVAREARTYIRTICLRYPLQLRAVMGYPMWLRFCDTWNHSGNATKAMRAI